MYVDIHKDFVATKSILKTSKSKRLGKAVKFNEVVDFRNIENKGKLSKNFSQNLATGAKAEIKEYEEYFDEWNDAIVEENELYTEQPQIKQGPETWVVNTSGRISKILDSLV